jgi:uncharacterized SAM-binding protein YcdF (DUF218 family)
MDIAASIVKASLVPGSVALLLYGTALGVLMLYLPGLRRVGRVWLTLLVLVYWILALPAFSERLQRRGDEGPSRITRAADARGATAIVVLGNGAVTYTDGPLFVPALTRRTAYNVLEGARLYALLQQPLVIVSGGIVSPGTQRMSEADIMAAELQRMGVPASRIVREGRSVNTFEQAVNVTPLLAEHREFVVITTPTHMPRTLALFEAQGRRPIPSPSNIGYEDPDTRRWRLYLPSPRALRGSELVVYEQLAKANTRLRGSLHSADTPE